ncbi:uncharacterized protein [Typha latifolia]|uniref:uncharacterized protein isoform X1 n=2 Tax=Typha latifolia TaxID=4733 RepID=UPI003C301C58
MPPAEEGRVSGEEAGRENISDLLPLGLVRAQLIPPAPNRRESAIDFLPDFGGASWIAYGAASLLVISHFPSPLSSHEIKVGPLFRQVIEMPPPSDATAATSVNAVSWCPAIPSEGEIAAAAGSCIWMYSPVPTRDGSGSFCWKQAATIVETFIVDTIEWTGSGDGLIVAGIDVVLWVRKETSWEMTWRSRAKVPQVLVSATWLAEGPVATGAHAVAHCNGTNPAAASSFSGEEYKHVFVYLSDEKSGLTKIQLCHPQPVSMIQWRPFTRAQSEKDASHVWRNVLLTCCLDGTVRLWSENEIGRSRKIGKDAHDLRNTRRSFNVIAVIEINKCSKGMLGKDIFVKWAIEFGGVISKGEGDRYDLWPSDFEQHQVGKCEWLIGIESNFSVTFWAIHCLDDVSPARFPRVTLWRKQHLMDLKTSVINYDSSNSEGQPIFIKVVASRRLCFGSPDVCSLLQLLPDNSIIWSMLYNPILDSTDDVVSSKNITEKCLFSFAGEVLNQDGHTGTIRQVCVHPYSCEIEIAASLDSDGLLLLWSISTFSTFTWNLQTALHPLWRLLGRIYLRDLSTDSGYSCLSWAPSILDDNQFLLLGSENGIDCFIIRVPGTGENVLCQKILTIPYGVGKNGEGPPDHVFSTPVTSNCGKSLLSSSFLLFCIWKKKFQALSWKVVLHSGDPNEGYCGCGFDAKSILFEGKMYFAKVYLGSSVFPSPQESDQTTSSAIVSMNKSVLSVEQYVSSYNGSGNSSPSYHLVTGCFDGTLKLWKMSCEENAFHSEKEILSWDLVGMFTAHQGAVTAISLSSCGFKIASASTSPQTNITSLHVWEPVCLMGGGSFLFEDAIILQDTVVGLSWVSLGNGQLLLGVCLPNELRIYCHRRPSGQNLVHSEKSKEMHFWNYIAVAHSYPVIKEFFWGPKVTPVLVHEKHFSLFSQWQFRTDLKDSVDHSITYSAAVREYFPSITNIEGTNIYKAGSSKGSNNGKNGCADCPSCTVTSNQHNDPNFMNRLFNLMDIVDRLGGRLAVYHPQALIQHLYSGNWKRAQIVLQHLAESIRTSETSTTNMECTGLGESGHIIPEIHLSDYFMDTTSTNFSYKGLQWGENTTTRVSDFHFHANVLHDVASQKSEVTGFAHTLNKCLDVAAITDIERMQILVIVDLLVEISDLSRASAYKTLDEPGRRFWVAVEFQRRYFLRKFGNSAAAEGFLVDSASVAWALQSDCQDDLLKSLLSLEPTWPEMRNLGIGLWYTNVTQLRTKMEKLARLQYLKNKDPKECALLYLALNRRQVLASLFKISKDEKDKPLFGFLSRNFQEEKNKAAALKNAYVLMGRHQLELAVAFFLLGNDPSSAVTVCAKNLGDEQLALIICRLVEGYGGPLEHHLISNVLLPNAIEKEDYWLSSILEWTLGNFSQSVQKLFDSHFKTQTGQSAAMGNRAVCSDPKIGQYCVYLSTKNNFKNSVGDALAAKLSKLSTSLVASALKRIGLPLEALECLSSTLSIDTKDQGSSLHVGDQIFHKMLNPFPGAAPNWLSRDVAANFELNAKLNMASEYVSHLLIGHPQWPDVGLTREVSHKEHDDFQIGGLKHDVEIAISVLRKKFSLKLLDLAGMILVFACNKGFPFLAYLLFHANRSPENEADNCGLDASSSTSSYTLFRLLLKANEEICYFVARYVVSCHFTDSTLKLVCNRNFTFENDYNEKVCLPKLTYLLRSSRSILKHYNGGIFANKNTLSIYAVLDLLEYSVEFAFTWLQKDMKGLIMMIAPILDASVNSSTFLVIIDELMKVLHKKCHDASRNGVKYIPDDYFPERQLKNSEDSMPPIDEKWHLIGASLWIHLLTFMKNHLDNILVIEKLQDESSKMNKDLTNMFPFHVVDLLVNSLNCVTSSLIKQFASFIRHKISKNILSGTLFWLDEYNYSQSGSLNHFQDLRLSSLLLSGNEDKESLFSLLWKISVSPQDICVSLANESVNYFPHNGQKLSMAWKDMEKSASVDYEIGASENSRAENEFSSTSPSYGTGRRFIGRAPEADDLLETRRKHPSAEKETSYFHNPRELKKRNGELFEAICFNSINEHQVAVASNKKGLLFLNWNGEQHFKRQTEVAEYIWSECDWPQDGWAGSESTPIPTYVSPGIGLGSKRGAHLGLGGATTGLGSLARPRRDLMGGGAFGIPGYAGIGASGLGWGEQEDFEEYVDPPATVENVHSRALSHHPTRPFFLVGSSNTHVYLWEFGKDRALATYGVLPAANVPPPYALASVSSLQFDYYGHRFATAALDGTICTWQLEVGGRSNIHPLDSSLCFNNHASDVAYVSGSGSILAAAGCSSNGANVVIWDTLAPPPTCQASVFCHEGGARSLSVFDNDIGSGSISPLIVTGGKNGDVGLHDFRYIATGKTKRHKNCNELDLKSTVIHDTTYGAPNIGDSSNGMLWYIPKAHLGSVTRISTIPNTSLFLTGSKDGDVKLWDARRSQLVFHWQKLHDRHTFFQPNSRGFGGVVRAAVTDIQVLSHGFLTCGGDGSVKLIELQ